jgi:hypothetical protein
MKSGIFAYEPKRKTLNRGNGISLDRKVQLIQNEKLISINNENWEMESEDES